MIVNKTPKVKSSPESSRVKEPKANHLATQSNATQAFYTQTANALLPRANSVTQMMFLNLRYIQINDTETYSAGEISGLGPNHSTQQAQ